MTGRKSTKVVKKKATQREQQQAQQVQDDLGSPPANIKREQPPPAQTVKKILKVDNDEARTLKTVFKSNPDSQMKDFIKKAEVSKPPLQAAKVIAKTPADTHTAAIAQELLETDDDVADNLAKLFKASKSYKNA